MRMSAVGKLREGRCMKVALKLLLSYLVASFLMMVLSTVLHPPHAHLPFVVVVLTFPLVPWVTFRDFFATDIELDKALLMGAFVLMFGGMAWVALRSRGKV